MVRPNLVFIFSDEQRHDTLDCYGDQQIHTPNLDKLAQQSYVMDELYCSQPVCTPSRSTIMTGLMPHATGAYTNNEHLDPDVKTLPELLPDEVRSQYATGYAGKWHLGDEIFAQHGFDEWYSVEDEYRPWYSEGRDRTQMCTYGQWLLEKGMRPDGPGGMFTRDRCCTFPERLGKPQYLGDVSCDFIERHKDEPFILYINFLEPHMPFFGPRSDNYNPDDLEVSPNFLRMPTEKDSYEVRMRAAGMLDGGFDWYSFKEEAGWREFIAAYYGLCELVDHHTGRVIDKLEELGLSDNTIIVYTSDHGELMGSHRSMGKSTMQQESVRVPGILKTPAQKEGRRVNGPASQVDLVPTLLDLMGAEVPEGLHGKSLKPWLSDKDTILEEDVFIQWNLAEKQWDQKRKAAEEKGIPQWRIDICGSEEMVLATQCECRRTIISKEGWRLTVNPWSKVHELFDLNNDPYEFNNLSGEPEQQAWMHELLGRIKAWQVRVEDTVELPDVL